MKNSALFDCAAQQILSEAFDGDDVIYEDDVRTLIDGTVVVEHVQISKAQAKAIMQRIVDDGVIAEALRDGIRSARLNPNGNMPINGDHPVDPAIDLIEERAVVPVLGARPPFMVVRYFARVAYDRVK